MTKKKDTFRGGGVLKSSNSLQVKTLKMFSALMITQSLHTYTCHISDYPASNKTSPAGDVLKSKAQISDNGANPLSLSILPDLYGLISRYRRMSVPSALMPPAGGVPNAVPSR
jgi:hypothetical protein